MRKKLFIYIFDVIIISVILTIFSELSMNWIARSVIIGILIFLSLFLIDFIADRIFKHSK